MRNMTTAAAVTPKMSPTCIRHGVHPRMWPAFRSCIISPATDTLVQVNAATPSTAATAATPFIPNATMRSAATISTDTVRPLVGLLLTPMMPTRYPETAAKTKPRNSITTAATAAGTRLCVK